MRCKICGFNYIKPSDTCCPQCGVSVEDLKNVKEDFYKKNKIKRKRSFRVPGIITAAFIPILGFISYLKGDNNKKNILITSIISLSTYLLTIGCLLISFCVIKRDVYYLIDSKPNQYSIKYKLTLSSLNRVQGSFKITGYEKIDYQFSYLVFDDYGNSVLTSIYAKSKLSYKASGRWTQTKKDDVIKLLFTKEILKLNIKTDNENLIRDTYYEVYSSVIGKEKTNDLLDEKKVKLTYELGTTYAYVAIQDGDKTFNYYNETY